MNSKYIEGVNEIIQVNENSQVVRRQILVIDVPFIMKDEEIKHLRCRIFDQMKSGLVILPHGVRAITCDADTIMVKDERIIPL